MITATMAEQFDNNTVNYVISTSCCKEILFRLFDKHGLTFYNTYGGFILQ